LGDGYKGSQLMSDNITISGLPELRNRLDPLRLDGFMTRAGQRGGNVMETTAKQNISRSVYSTPSSPHYRRTGYAQQSIVFSYRGDKGQVTMGAEYGKYLEQGTGVYIGRRPWYTSQIPGSDGVVYIRGMKKRPFWKPAENETKRRAPDIVQDIFNKF